jgi:hypothetical protein
MKGSFRTALIAAVVSAVVASGAAVATTQTFTLGTTNTVDAASTVTAGATGLNAKLLQLTNNSTGSSATALGLTTPSSRPPMIVSSPAKVANLNADKLDGTDSTGFVPAAAVRRVGPLTVTASSSFPPPYVPLAVIGQLTFLANCYDEGLGHPQDAVLNIRSSVDHGAFADLTQVGAGTTFGSADMGAGSTDQLAHANAPSGTQVFTPVTGEALSADGHQVFYDLYMGQNARGQAGKCVFGGSFVVK